MSVTAWKQPTELVRVPMPYEEYLAIPSEIHAEWVDGVVVMAPAAVYDHNEIAFRLAIEFRTRFPSTAQMLDSTVYLPRNRERRPDLTLLVQRPTGDYWRHGLDPAPLVIVEVISPSTRSEDWIRKAHDYAIAGVGQYWLVDAAARQLTVLELVEGEWRDLLLLDAEQPTGEVSVGEYGTVAIDLDSLLDV